MHHHFYLFIPFGTVRLLLIKKMSSQEKTKSLFASEIKSCEIGFISFSVFLINKKKKKTKMSYIYTYIYIYISCKVYILWVDIFLPLCCLNRFYFNKDFMASINILHKRKIEQNQNIDYNKFFFLIILYL